MARGGCGDGLMRSVSLDVLPIPSSLTPPSEPSEPAADRRRTSTDERVASESFFQRQDVLRSPSASLFLLDHLLRLPFVAHPAFSSSC